MLVNFALMVVLGVMLVLTVYASLLAAQTQRLASAQSSSFALGFISESEAEAMQLTRQGLEEVDDADSEAVDVQQLSAASQSLPTPPLTLLPKYLAEKEPLAAATAAGEVTESRQNSDADDLKQLKREQLQGSQASDEGDGKNTEEEEDSEEPGSAAHNLDRNGCPFGWHSPSQDHPTCFHVSPIVSSLDEAAETCRNQWITPKSYVAKLSSVMEADYVCSIQSRNVNRHTSTSSLFIGLDPASREWRDGTKASNDFPFVESSSSNSKKSEVDFAVTLICPEAKFEKVSRTQSYGFACSAPKTSTKRAALESREDIADSNANEVVTIASISWVSIEAMDSSSKAACSSLPRWPIKHDAVSLATLPSQIAWSLTSKPRKSEAPRYFLIWQSKGHFGWLDFWVDYLVDHHGFKGAPVGRFVTSSRTASKRTGYSSVFANPGTVAKYKALVVLSRHPIPPSVLSYFPPGVLVNHIYTDPMWPLPLNGDKRQLVAALGRFAAASGCGSPDQLRVMPLTFDSGTLEGCRAFTSMSRDKQANSELWIVKGPKHGGSQVSVLPARSVALRLSECGADVLARNELVQRLVVDVLLLGGRKVDLRVFVLFASVRPLQVYVHRQPYFRAAMHQYDGQKNTAAFVTNTHVQKKTGNFSSKDWQDHIWLLDHVKELGEKEGLPTTFWESKVFPRIKRSVRVIVSATADTLTDRREGQWKLFGVDFVVDKAWQPWLVDWNVFPGWDWSYRHLAALRYRRMLLDDTWRLVLDTQRGAALVESDYRVPRSGSYELIYHDRTAAIDAIK